MRPIAFMNIAAALLFAGVLVATVARTTSVAASPAMPATTEGATTTATAAPAEQAPQTAPPTLPAGYIGEEACTTCHTGYDASIKASKHGQAKNPRTPAAAQGCESCQAG